MRIYAVVWPGLGIMNKKVSSNGQRAAMCWSCSDKAQEYANKVNAKRSWWQWGREAYVTEMLVMDGEKDIER